MIGSYERSWLEELYTPILSEAFCNFCNGSETSYPRKFKVATNEDWPETELKKRGRELAREILKAKEERTEEKFMEIIREPLKEICLNKSQDLSYLSKK